MKYTLVTAKVADNDASHEEFVIRVNSYTRNGWIPAGGVSATPVVTETAMEQHFYVYLAQALVKMDEGE